MQPAEGFLQDGSAPGGGPRGRDWVIEPWIPAQAEIVVYEYGARLDERSQLLAREQIEKARRLHNELVMFIRGVHADMNTWVLAQAGSEAQAAAAQLHACEEELARARAAGAGETLRALALQRLDLDKRLVQLLRPVRARHRDALRRDFFGKR